MSTNIEKTGTGAITKSASRCLIAAITLLIASVPAFGAQEFRYQGLTVTLNEANGHVAAVYQQKEAGSFLVGAGQLEDGFGTVRLLGASTLAKVDGAGTGADKVDGAGTGAQKVDGAGTGAQKVDGAGTGAAKVDGAGTGADKVDGAGTGAEKLARTTTLELLQTEKYGLVAILREEQKGHILSETVFNARNGTLELLEEIMVVDF
ncbi:MAG: hypothetical protein AAF358_24900 [Pseudomonadota bacterium]